jgi:hypothetical protein
VWGDTFDFSISTEKELNLRVMDKADVGQPKFIGQTTVSIMQWLAKGSFDGDIEIQDQKGTPSGSVSLSVKFSKPGSGAPPPPPGKPAPPMPGDPVKGAAAPGYEPPRDPNGKFTDHEIKEAFEAFDLDHNHFVGAAELRHVLINIGEQVTDDEVDEMIRMCDKDGGECKDYLCGLWFLWFCGFVDLNRNVVVGSLNCCIVCVPRFLCWFVA